MGFSSERQPARRAADREDRHPPGDVSMPRDDSPPNLAPSEVESYKARSPSRGRGRPAPDPKGRQR